MVPLLPLLSLVAAAGTRLVEGELAVDPPLVDYGSVPDWMEQTRTIRLTWVTGSAIAIRGVSVTEGPFDAWIVEALGSMYDSRTGDPFVGPTSVPLEVSVVLPARPDGFAWGELIIDHNGQGCGTRVPLRAHVFTRHSETDPDDRDGDGFTLADGDCDDDDGWAAPDRPEWCDGVDNDCDGALDEGCDRDPEELGCTWHADARGCTTTQARASAAWLLIALLAPMRRRPIRDPLLGVLD